MTEKNMIQNPILPGFNPDPCICRRGDDYYLTTSTFEWLPGLPIYHSKDLKNWKLITHVLGKGLEKDLVRIGSSNGIWAPCLTWCEEDQLFYMAYTIMQSKRGGNMDLDNYVITAKNIMGPWSEPVYLHSAGFDPSLFHDDDGRKWIVALEWETRKDGYKPGYICLVEYDAVNKKTIGLPKRIWKGSSDRGWVEGPHIYKHNGMYYLLCAEGGTFYNHCTTIARCATIDGTYESDPTNPILTSTDQSDLIDPDMTLQKAGHGSMIETQLGEVYMVHHLGRPFLPEKRCTLGRETGIQKMKWTDDGWLRLDGDNGRIISEYVPASKLPEHKWEPMPEKDDFDEAQLPLGYYSPRRHPESFTDLNARKGYLRIRGCESMNSDHNASIVVKKLTSLNVIATTKMDFHPTRYQHEAGLIFYYSDMNYYFLKKYYSERLGSEALMIVSSKLGKRDELLPTEIAVPSNQEIWLRVVIDGRSTYFYWSLDGENYSRVGDVYATSDLSDETNIDGQGFTGSFVGMACADYLMHQQYADFDFFDYHIKK